MATPLIPPQIEDIIQAARNLLNQPDPNNSFWTDQELLSYINEAVRIYFAELTDIDEGHFTTTATLDIVSGAELVTLPSDFFKAKVVYKRITNGYEPLNYVNNLNQGYYTDGGGDSADTYFPDYFFRGNSLVLHPVPNFTDPQGLLLEYMQYPLTLLDGTDTLSAQISPVFRQVIEMYTVYKAKVKESLVNGTRTDAVAKENLGDLTQQFRDLNRLRSKNQTYVQPFNPEGEGF